MPLKLDLFLTVSLSLVAYLLTLVYALPGGERPQALQAEEGKQLFRLRRIEN